jgi:hypothetical protein
MLIFFIWSISLLMDQDLLLHSQYTSGNRRAKSERIHADPDTKHCLKAKHVGHLDALWTAKAAQRMDWFQTSHYSNTYDRIQYKLRLKNKSKLIILCKH